MSEIKIWIDADSCPVLVRNHCVKTASKLNLEIFFVANKSIPCEEGPFKMIICNEKKDAADDYIIQNASKSDIVITRDIVFADRLVEKEITAINDRGTSFTKQNIKDLLSDRDFDFALAQAGVVKKYKSSYDKKDFSKFADCFDRELTRLIRIRHSVNN